MDAGCVEMLSADSAAWGSGALELRDAPGLHPGPSGDLEGATRPLPAAGASVAVVGAGPAGLLAAHLLARRHGCHVHLFDRRAHPGAAGAKAADDDDRAFAVAMNVRGMEAAAAAGLDVAAFTAAGDMCEVRDTLLGRGDDALQRALVVPFDRPRIVGSRQAFVRALLRQVEAQEAAARAGGKGGGSTHGGSITFHWGVALAGADLAARTAAFQLADGGSEALQYDLLVAADGYWSKARRAAEQQAPELRVEALPPNRQYKTIRGLAPHASLPLGPAADGGPGRLCMMQEAAGAGKPPGNIFFSQPSEAAGVTAVLSMPHARWEGLEGGDAEAYGKLLAAGYPSLPAGWREEMAKQMAAKPLFETGMQVHASQLHAPGLVLLGDAAHAVSPATSNGMNSALEDAWVLSQALEACGGDLAALPQRYTAARLEDARALLWLDRTMGALAGRGGGGAALKVAIAARLLLAKISGGRVAQHALVRFKDGSLAYGAARRSVERDAAVARALGWALAAGAAAAAAAAAARCWAR